MLAATLLGLSIAELALIVGALAYVTSILRDWRPLRSMRAENRELRTDLNSAYGRIEELESEVKDLKSATDMTGFQHEQRRIADALSLVVAELKQLAHDVHANTAAVELIAKKDMITDALGSREGAA